MQVGSVSVLMAQACYMAAHGLYMGLGLGSMCECHMHGHASGTQMDCDSDKVLR